MWKIISLIALCLYFFANNSLAYDIVNVQVNGRIYQAREGYLLVRHKTGIRAESVNQIHAMAEGEVRQRFSYPEGLELVKIKSSANSLESLNVYQQSNDIVYAEPDYIWNANELPNDPMFSKQWALRNLGQGGGTANADINAVAAWGLTTGDHRIVLGTIDTGVDYTHPDLANNIWVNRGEIPANGVDDDGNGFIDDVHGINAITSTGDPMDDNMHGTHVAGIIAAQQNNGIGVSGVAPNVSVAACKFLDASGSGDTAAAITCLNYFRDLSLRSQDPVRIVATNNSWGGGPFSQALYDAIKVNQDAGILFIAAASNDGQNNDKVGTYPANYYLSNLISVEATDNNDNLASFSNYGRISVSVAAPGVDILSTLPSEQYGYLSGTSMAAPHVTGLSGLIASFTPNLSWIGIKNLILSGGETTAASLGTTVSGNRIMAYGENGTGSLTCSKQTVTSRLLPRQSKVTLKVGQSLSIALLNIKCEGPNRITRFAMMTDGVSATALGLKDDGQGIDQVANDGIFSGTWTAKSKGTFRLRFPRNDIVTINVQ